MVVALLYEEWRELAVAYYIEVVKVKRGNTRLVMRQDNRMNLRE